jgi:uncharacterized protein involved in exopolysaccharide biosynthesis
MIRNTSSSIPVVPDQQDPYEQSGDIDLVAIWRFLWGSKYPIMVAAFVCAALAGVIAFNITPIFRAESVVLAVPRGPMGGAGSLANQLGGLASLASLAGVNLDSSGSADREAKAILGSRELAEEFVRRNNLIPELFPKPNPAKPPTLWLAVKTFREGVLTVREDKRTGLTTISIEWKDAGVAARWANSYVGLANEQIRARAIDEANRNIKFLNEQIDKTRVVEVQRSMYSLIENETKTLMLASARDEYAFSVIDPAVPPERKISPHRSLYVLFGAFVGFALAWLAAYVRSVRVQRANVDTPNA